MDNAELNSAKKSVIVTGLAIQEKKGDNWSNLDRLFRSVLGTNAEIEDFYQLGASLVVTFSTMESKRVVMKYKYLLKDIKGPENRVYINEYLPPAIQEKRRP